MLDLCLLLHKISSGQYDFCKRFEIEKILECLEYALSTWIDYNKNHSCYNFDNRVKELIETTIKEYVDLKGGNEK